MALLYSQTDSITIVPKKKKSECAWRFVLILVTTLSCGFRKYLHHVTHWGTVYASVRDGGSQRMKRSRRKHIFWFVSC